MIQHNRLIQPTTFHLQGCDCDICDPRAPGDRHQLSAGRAAVMALAGCATGNAIAFAIDPQGSWHALTSAAAHLIRLL